MRILRVGLVIGLLATVSACSSDGDAATSTVAPDPGASSSATIATEPSVTTTSSTAPAVATSEPPVTTAPTVTTGPTSTAETPVSAPRTSPNLVDVRIYLLRNERLAVTHRQVEGPAVIRNTLTELLNGPTDAERHAGLHTEIPDDTTLRDLNLADGLVTVDLSSDYERGGGSLSTTARLAQVIFTVTQFDNVDEVVFWLDGAPVEFFGGEGIELDGAQERQDVDWAVTKGIIIDTPLPGATVTSPITVTGEGDVYEADFPMEIRRDGQRISDVAIVFAGAWGDWADFRTTIAVDAPAGPIELVASSPVGCTPDSEPNCPVDLETIVPLTLSR